MSYEPLHHKYRPQIFADLVGQEAIATTLSNAIATQRIAPAYLFTGPRGTGKTSSARILAKSLNCIQTSVPTAQPCGKCQVCLSITDNYAVDVIEIDAASNTGVDNIRDIIERAQFAPVQCRYKVYVIDECHMLSTAAFNSLLKTLEEPPDRVVFVLATTDPQRVLPTIISRCQRFDFRRIPLGEMVQHLKYIAAEEKINISPEAIALVAQVAQGGLRDAESLLDQLSLLTVEITIEKVWDLVGAVPERDLMALTEAIASNDTQTVIEHCRRLLDRGREPLIVLQNLASFYRDLLIAKTAPNRSDLVALTPATWTQLREFAASQDTARILQGAQQLKTSEIQIKNTTQPRLWLEVTILGLLPSALIAPSTNQSLRQENREAPATRNAPLTSPSASVPPIPNHVPPQVSSSPTPAQIPHESPQEQPSNHANELDQWQQVLAYLPPSSKALFGQHGYLIALNNQQAQVGIRSPNLIKAAQPKLATLEQAFQKAFKQQIKVVLSINSSAQNKPPEAPSVSVITATPETQAPLEATIDPPPKPSSVSPQTSAPHVTPVDTPPQLPVQASIPATSPVALSDWNTEEVEKAMDNLQQFFEGEIVDLSDDLLSPEGVIAATLEKVPEEDSFNAVVARLETPLLTTISEALTRQNAVEASNLNEPVTPPSRQSTLHNRPEISPDWDDDDDIPF